MYVSNLPSLSGKIVTSAIFSGISTFSYGANSEMVKFSPPSTASSSNIGICVHLVELPTSNPTDTICLSKSSSTDDEKQ